jgi:hypothetical protein
MVNLSGDKMMNVAKYDDGGVDVWDWEQKM